MGSHTLKLPVNDNQIAEQLVTGYVIARDDAAGTATVVCDRMDDTDLAGLLKGLKYDPDVEAPDHDAKTLAAAEAAHETAVARADAEERLAIVKADLEQCERDAEHIAQEVAKVAGKIEERTKVLDEVTAAYEAASEALAAAQGDEVERGIPIPTDVKTDEALAERRTRAAAQDVHFAVVDLQLARDAETKWRRTELETARANVAAAESALAALGD